MAVVRPISVTDSALKQRSEITVSIPTQRCVSRWTSLGLITPARPPEGIGKAAGYSALDVTALHATRVLQDEWSKTFEPTQLPGEVVKAVWEAVHEGTKTLALGTDAVCIHVDVAGLLE